MGERIVSTGGRFPTLYTLGENDDYVILSSNGSVYEITNDLILIGNNGSFWLERAFVKIRDKATVHGRQKLVIFERIPNPIPRYIYWAITDGSYQGITVEIRDKDTNRILYDEYGRYIFIHPDEIDIRNRGEVRDEERNIVFWQLGKYQGHIDEHRNKNIYLRLDLSDLAHKEMGKNEVFIARTDTKNGKSLKVVGIIESAEI